MNVTQEELEQWLLEQGVDEHRGYGHMCAEDLAELLVGDFHIKRKGDLTSVGLSPEQEQRRMHDRARARAGEEGIGY